MLSIAGYEWGWDNARALLGILLIYGVCWVLSERETETPSDDFRNNFQSS